MHLLAFFSTIMLFVGPVILAIIGWPVEGDAVEGVHLYPTYYALLIYLFVAFLSKKIDVRYNREALLIVIFIFFWYVFNRTLGRSASKMILFNSMILPAFYFVFFSSLKGIVIQNKIKTMIILLFFINSLIAIYERIAMVNFFPFDVIRTDVNIGDISEKMIFRSSALLGHPLTNALIMAIIMVFVLLSDIKPLYKYTLYSIGMFGLFCFNSRASIMISGITFGLYMIHPLFQREATVKQKLASISIIIVAIIGVLYLIEAGYGGRFEERGDFSSDSSALARINVWGIFTKYDLDFFLWGMPGKDAEEIANAVMGVANIENWFIMSVMVVGLIVTTIVIMFFIPLFRKSLSSFSRFDSILILLVVLGLSSANNSLACGVPAIATFFVCCYAFKPYKNSFNRMFI